MKYLQGALTAAAFAGIYVVALLLFNLLASYQKSIDKLEAEQHSVALLSQVVLSNALIDAELTRLLLAIPWATGARVSVIHERISNVSMLPYMRFDHNNSVVPLGAGVVAPALSTDLPLSLWSDSLPTFLDDKCGYWLVAELTNAEQRLRIAPTAAAYIGCPLIDQSGLLVGAMFVFWLDLTHVPSNLTEATQHARESSRLISSYLQTRRMQSP